MAGMGKDGRDFVIVGFRFQFKNQANQVNPFIMVRTVIK